MFKMDKAPVTRMDAHTAVQALHAEHATLRRLARDAIRRSLYSADETLSTMEFLADHERREAQLFASPFFTRPDGLVTKTAARLQDHYDHYMSGEHSLPDAKTASALFFEALLNHITAEEAWLEREDQYQRERLSIPG